MQVIVTKDYDEMSRVAAEIFAEGIKANPEIRLGLATGSTPVGMYQCLIEHHAQSVLNGTPLTAEDALHNIELCEAAHESAQNGGKVIELN